VDELPFDCYFFVQADIFYNSFLTISFSSFYDSLALSGLCSLFVAFFVLPQLRIIIFFFSISFSILKMMAKMICEFELYLMFSLS